jgi:hypothetical protein
MGERGYLHVYRDGRMLEGWRVERFGDDNRVVSRSTMVHSGGRVETTIRGHQGELQGRAVYDERGWMTVDTGDGQFRAWSRRGLSGEPLLTAVEDKLAQARTDPSAARDLSHKVIRTILRRQLAGDVRTDGLDPLRILLMKRVAHELDSDAKLAALRDRRARGVTHQAGDPEIAVKKGAAWTLTLEFRDLWHDHPAYLRIHDAYSDGTLQFLLEDLMRGIARQTGNLRRVALYSTGDSVGLVVQGPEVNRFGMNL